MIAAYEIQSEYSLQLILIAQKLVDDCLDYHNVGDNCLVLCMDGGDVWLVYLPEDEINLDMAKKLSRII